MGLLAALLEECERQRRGPEQAWAMVIFLLTKADGGSRPICLLPGLVRVWEAWRVPAVRAWGESVRKPHGRAAKGESAEAAVWRSVLEGKANGGVFESATVLLDLAPACGHVPLARL